MCWWKRCRYEQTKDVPHNIIIFFVRVSKFVSLKVNNYCFVFFNREFSNSEKVCIILRMLLFQSIKRVNICLFLKERITISKERNKNTLRKLFWFLSTICRLWFGANKWKPYFSWGYHINVKYEVPELRNWLSGQHKY